jgi:exo-beta-1,3-glucanase (GH17 family)
LRTPNTLRTSLPLFFASIGLVVAAWWWLASPVTLVGAPIDPAAKLECVSYAPFRGDQTPHNPKLIVSPEQVAEDLGELAKVTKCIRTYSIDNGLDMVPELASRAGLKVLLGVWIGRDRAKNVLLINHAVALANDHPGVVTSLIVGSEVLLRGDMTVSDLREFIRSAKSRVKIPVTYADVWEFWLRYREMAADVDFVTVHMLPYWEDFPPRAEDAAAHVDSIRKQVAVAFPGKEILIGEAGWPSFGRMRDGSLASRINQARFISEILERARVEKFRVNLFEAYDEPWKRKWEGSVGGYWGMFNAGDRRLKYPAGVAIGNYPRWKWQMAGGVVLGILVFATAGLALRRRPSSPGLAAWMAVAISATTSGVLLGISFDKLLYESFGFDGWLRQCALLATAIAAPLLSSHALMSERPIPAFLDILGPAERRTQTFMATLLGVTLIAVALISVETALGLVFDGRWRDFPFAALTMAVVPLATLSLLSQPRSGARPIAEVVFAGLLALAAVYIVFNEGFANWQSLWTCAVYLLLAFTLVQAREGKSSELKSSERWSNEASGQLH